MEEKAPELIPINVIIAGRSYRIRVAREDEGFVAMCLLMYATDKRNSGADALAEEEIDSLIEKIDKALDVARD